MKTSSIVDMEYQQVISCYLGRLPVPELVCIWLCYWSRRQLGNPQPIQFAAMTMSYSWQTDSRDPFLWTNLTTCTGNRAGIYMEHSFLKPIHFGGGTLWATERETAIATQP